MKKPIRSWAEFDRRIRHEDRPLFARLDRFRDSILVSGCQRSGTTAISRLLTSSPQMTDFQFSKDDELDAALILSGWIDYESEGRHCFQTTYVNNSFPEYAEHTGYRLIWVLRNPSSVVLSMLTNWRRGALNRLFQHCGQQLLSDDERRRYERFGAFVVAPLRRACLSYTAKVRQILQIKRFLDDQHLLVIDYDDLVTQKSSQLPRLFEFARLPYSVEYLHGLHDSSLRKAENFYKKHHDALDPLCSSAYHEARSLLSL